MVKVRWNGVQRQRFAHVNEGRFRKDSSRELLVYVIARFVVIFGINTKGAIHSTKISGNFGPNSMDRFGPTGKDSKKLVHLLRWSSFFRSDRSEFWLNGSHPKFHSLGGLWNYAYNNFEMSRVVFMPKITYKSCYYLFMLLLAKVVA